jgi:hypothetical protein
MDAARIDNRDVRKRGERHPVRALSFHSLRHSFVRQLAGANVLTDHSARRSQALPKYPKQSSDSYPRTCSD